LRGAPVRENECKRRLELGSVWVQARVTLTLTLTLALTLALALALPLTRVNPIARAKGFGSTRSRLG